ncbi:WhiB family transcriptional regulator [Nocardia uniformis]|uniref:Transcriptional regulator WhiB n=1 Tax=Nocardia uniformis TaxID=53432 RepID=A0A849CA20_9NOCA|nr:WhiB family transcriptional regulator [Nocardia uniformis]NNH73210.1 WhiB family transcriptional regulator [Nocardia uniformis]
MNNPSPQRSREWQLRGSCRGMPSAVFYHPDHERGRARNARIRLAKRICANCPVLAECRAYALAAGEQYGIWGGMSESERQHHFHSGQDRAAHSHTSTMLTSTGGTRS